MTGTISIRGGASLTATDADKYPVLAEHPLATVNTDFIFDPGNSTWPAEPYDGTTIFPDLGPAGPADGNYGIAVDGTKPPDLSGNELVFAAGTKEPMFIRKTGVANNRVGEPSLEGFKRHMIIVTGTLTSNPAVGTAFIGAGQASAWWGVTVTSGGGGTVGGGGSGVSFGSIIGTGEHTYGVEYYYNTGAGTTTVTLYMDSATPLGVRTSPTAPASLTVNNPNARCAIGGADSWNTLDGTVRYAQREFITSSGFSAAELMERALDYLAANP